MTRAEFARKVAEDTQSSYVASKKWTEAVLDCLADAIAHEEVLSLRNVGKFEHRVRAPKVGRNSKTGERVDIPARMVVKFTPCEAIDEKLRTEALN